MREKTEATIACRTAGRDGRGLRGLWAHRIIVDEAARVPDGVLEDVLPPMLADRGGEYVLASSPFGRRSAFYRQFARGMAPPPQFWGARDAPPPQFWGARVGEEAAPDASPVCSSLAPQNWGGGASPGAVYCQAFQCPTTDNAAHLDLAWLTSQREDMGEALYAQEYEAQFVDDFGAVFREEDIAAAIATLDGVRLEGREVVSEPQPGHPYIMGVDWGRKWDYTVVAVLDAAESPLRLVHLSRWRGTGWETQAADVAGLAACFAPRRILVDGSSIGDPIAEMLTRQISLQMPSARCRPAVERFVFGAESKQSLIDRLNVGLSARALRFPPHRTLLAELRGFEYAPGEGSRLKMGARSGGHDDTRDCAGPRLLRRARPGLVSLGRLRHPAGVADGPGAGGQEAPPPQFWGAGFRRGSLFSGSPELGQGASFSTEKGTSGGAANNSPKDTHEKSPGSRPGHGDILRPRHAV